MNYNVDNPFKLPRTLSLCTGIRGLERGIERAVGPIRTVAYVEIEAFIIENLLAGMEAGLVDAAPVWCNLKTFDARPFRGLVDIVTGGYPCQPFSTAGNRGGADDPRHLWPFVERIMCTIRPVFGFFENVSGHLTLGFDHVYRDLSALGYAVEAGIYTAEEVGAPHQRERLFIMAIRKDWLANAKRINWRLSESEGRQQSIETSGISETMGDPNRHGNQEGNADRRIEINTGSNEREDWQRERLWPEPSPAGAAMAYSQGITQREPADPENAEPGSRDARKEFGSGSAGVGLADTCTPGLSGIACGELRGFPKSNAKYKGSESGGIYTEGWPARPGEQQHPWEAPRTVEPGLGITVDGYNFREDLLRASGNGVVEQTAELAFLDLLKKHGL